jgi:hypothetical protein
MEAGKVIENVIIFGGIGAMGYLLLKKKPVVEQGATTKTLIDGVEESDYKKKEVEYCYSVISTDNPQYVTYSPAYKARCLAMQLFNELTEPLVDQNALQIKADYNTWDATTRDFYTPTGDIKANTCLELDSFIKERGQTLPNLYKLAGSGLSNYKPIIAITEKAKADAEAKFNKFNCRDKIEAVRTRSLIDLQTQGSIKAEKSIVGKGFLEQKTYIILGALVLLTGFYIVVKK